MNFFGAVDDDDDYSDDDKTIIPPNHVADLLVDPDGARVFTLGVDLRELPRDTQFEEESEDFIFTALPSVPIGATRQTHPEGWSECYSDGSFKDDILLTPGYPASLKRPLQRSHCIHETSYGGLGMFSTRPIEAGDFITSERALLLYPKDYRSTETWRSPGQTMQQARQQLMTASERAIQVSLNRMAPEDKAVYMSLVNVFTQDGSGPLFGILRTNAFMVQLDHEADMEPHLGVFNELSRVNHSCGPNARIVFDKASLAMRLTAVRDIEEDEEITIAYPGCNILQPTQARQTSLAKVYGFTCACRHCVDNDPQSFERRATVLAASLSPGYQSPTVTPILDWIHNPSLPDSHLILSAQNMLAILEQEQLQSHEIYETVLFRLCASYKALNTGNVAFLKFEKMLKQFNQAKSGGDEERFQILMFPSRMSIEPLVGARQKVKANPSFRLQHPANNFDLLSAAVGRMTDGYYDDWDD